MHVEGSEVESTGEFKEVQESWKIEGKREMERSKVIAVPHEN